MLKENGLKTKNQGLEDAYAGRAFHNQVPMKRFFKQVLSLQPASKFSFNDLLFENLLSSRDENQTNILSWKTGRQ